ncbi:MAG: hypothetical protein AAF533_05345 [Acidobacteriota bacterium]
MSRHVITSQLVLALLVNVPSAHAQQSASFELVSRSSSEHLNVRLISFPDVPSFEDRANSDLDNPCDLTDSAPDGLINADDAICAMWGGGDPELQLGSFRLAFRDPETCELTWRRIVARAGVAYTLGVPFEIVAGVGYLTQFPHDPELGEQVHAFTLSGPCEPRDPGVDLSTTCSAASYGGWLLHLPYDTTLEDTHELFCGEDYPDADGDGRPDECFDGLWPSGFLSVQQHFNEPGDTGWRAAALRAFFGRLEFPSPSFALSRGDALFVHGDLYRTEHHEPPRDGITCP